MLEELHQKGSSCFGLVLGPAPAPSLLLRSLHLVAACSSGPPWLWVSGRVCGLYSGPLLGSVGKWKRRKRHVRGKKHRGPSAISAAKTRACVQEMFKCSCPKILSHRHPEAARRRVCFHLITELAHWEARGIIACVICNKREDSISTTTLLMCTVRVSLCKTQTHLAIHTNVTHI